MGGDQASVKNLVVLLEATTPRLPSGWEKRFSLMVVLHQERDHDAVGQVDCH